MNKLPDDILFKISKHLKFNDLQNVRSLNRYFYRLTSPVINEIKSSCVKPYVSKFSDMDITSLIRWSKKNKYSLNHINIDKLIQSGNIKLFRYLIYKKIHPLHKNMFKIAAKHNQIDILKYLYFHHKDQISVKTTICIAIQYNHLNIIKYFHENEYENKYNLFDDDASDSDDDEPNHEYQDDYNSDSDNKPNNEYESDEESEHDPDVLYARDAIMLAQNSDYEFEAALTYALDNKNFEIIKYMCEYGATLKHYFYNDAIRNSDIETINFLDEMKCECRFPRPLYLKSK